MDTGSPQSQSDPQEILQSVNQELATLQARLSNQLTRDVDYLQAAKEKLLTDLDILEEEYQDLQARYDALQANYEGTLSQQQVAQQQLWAKRLAQALATHLKGRLTESLRGELPANGNGQPVSVANAYQLLSSLDATLNDTLHTLQQDLNSYRSSLSQQVSRMHSMEQQGEAILDALVTRLSQQLQTHTARPVALPLEGQEGSRGGAPPLSAASPPQGYRPLGATSGPRPGSPAPTGRPRSPGAAIAPRLAPRRSPPTSGIKRGWFLILIAALVLSLHNVVVAIIAYGGQLFGQMAVGGVFALTLPNALLLLWLRMVVVVPLLALVAGRIHSSVWQDLRQFLTAEDKRPLYQVGIGSGFLLISQILLYYSISDIGPGVAVTLLSLYPLVTLPLGWALFDHRLTSLRAVVLVAIAMGFVFVALPHLSGTFALGIASPGGILAALGAGVAFALYLVSMQISLRRLHPTSVSLVQFITLFLASTLLLLVSLVGGVTFQAPSSYAGLLTGGLLLGILTFLSYLFNTYGVKFMGSMQAAVITASSPLLTAVLAFLILPGERSTLMFVQWIGVLLVTLGLVALSFERLNGHRPRPS